MKRRSALTSIPSFVCVLMVTLSATASAQVTLVPTPPTPPPTARLEYDANGNLTKRKVGGSSAPSFSAVIDRLGRPEQTLNGNGEVVRLRFSAAGDLLEVTDPRSLATRYTRTGLGDLKVLVSPDTGSDTLSLDAAGNVTRRVDARGTQTDFVYDSLGRRTQASYRASAGGAPLSLTWTYDETAGSTQGSVGKLTSASHPHGSLRIRHDSFGQVIEQVLQTVTLSGGAVQLSTRYTSDSVERLTSLIYPSGRVVKFNYVNGSLAAMTLQQSATATETPLISSIMWEPGGTWRSLRLGGSTGNTVSRRIDTSGRLVSYPLGNLIRNVGYDDRDRITAYQHTESNGVASIASATNDQSFVYDSADRLSRVTWGQTNPLTLSYTYDATGNRASSVSGGIVRHYQTAANSNRLTSLTNPTRLLSYDAAGNTTQDTGLGYFGTYDARGRLTSIASGGSDTWYVIDALGRRVRKSNNASGPNAVQVFFAYGQAGQLLGEYNASGQAIREYVWLDGAPIALLDDPPGPNSQTFYVYSDHLNSPRWVVDTSGRTRWTWLVDPFGERAPNENPQGLGVFTLNLRFPGQYFDRETGLSYNYFRDLDASLGRYTQSDPIGLAGGINTYAYVEGNPVSNIDPLGLETYICRRPLGGAPGSYAPPLLNHTYVCVGSGANMVCGSTTASSGGAVSNFFKGSPGAPTTPATDYFKPEACERRWGEDSCIETCIANALKNPKRPKYGVGPAGTDCQEYTEDIVSTCEKRCVRR